MDGFLFVGFGDCESDHYIHCRLRLLEYALHAAVQLLETEAEAWSEIKGHTAPKAIYRDTANQAVAG
jgi:hypothetical protein